MSKKILDRRRLAGHNSRHGESAAGEDAGGPRTTLLDYRRSRRKRDPVADDAPLEDGYWRKKTLEQMNEREWESLCDNCGKCCVISLEDADSGELHLTDVSCKLFDTKACQCSDYANRKQYVHDCVKLTPKNVPKLDWLPKTCGYRLVSEGQDLFWWHPLVSGDPETVHTAGASVRSKTRGEGRLKTPGLMKHIKKWPAPLEKPPAKPRRRKRKGAQECG